MNIHRIYLLFQKFFRLRRMIEKVNILGVGISAIQMDDAISKMEEWIEKNEPHYVCGCNYRP